MPDGGASIIGPVVSSIAGGLMGGSKGGGSQQAGTTTNTQAGNTVQQVKSGPWDPITPFLLGGATQRRLKDGVKPIYKTVTTPGTGTGLTYQGQIGMDPNDPVFKTTAPTDQQVLDNPESDYETIKAPGLADEAARLYNDSGMTNEQKLLYGDQQDWLSAALRDPNLFRGTWEAGAQANQGKFDFKPTDVNATQVTPAGARASQGVLDPTSSLSQLLSGQVNNPYLAGMQQAATGNAMQQYKDATDTAMQQYLPNVRSGAVAAGQYGGSRQGIAEGLVGQQLMKNARDLGIASQNAGSQLYGSALENAQQRMYGTANALDERALQTATGNANRSMAADQFNNQMGLAAANQNLNARVVGSNLINAGVQGQNNIFDTYNNNLNTLRNDGWTQLRNYQGTILPLAQLGSSQNSNGNTSGSNSSPYYTNQGANILGGAAAGAGIWKNLNGNLGFGNGSGFADLYPNSAATLNGQIYGPVQPEY